MKSILLSVLIGLVLTDCPSIKYVEGGLSWNGWAGKSWECCKPNCAWTSVAGKGNECKVCDTNGNIIPDGNAKCHCEGGQATTCLSQVPFTESGCSNIGFAFAIVPFPDPSICGKCFEFTFTGQGRYETLLNQKKLKGKKLIVMASNIELDAQEGRFDILIPGGGDGINLNGHCYDIFGSNTGSKIGGLLTSCENEVGWGIPEEQIYTGRKQCLSQKCNSVFSNNTQAKKGCLFLADFLEAATAPLVTYREVECPTQLKSKYK